MSKKLKIVYSVFYILFQNNTSCNPPWGEQNLKTDNGLMANWA